MNIKQPQGFSLIELMITVAIVGVLAAVVTPSYRSYIVRGQVDSCYKFFTPARLTADALIMANSGSSASITDAGVLGLIDGAQPAGSDCETINTSGAGTDGNLSINGTVAGNTMTWRRTGATGVWQCRSSNADLGLDTCP